MTKHSRLRVMQAHISQLGWALFWASPTLVYIYVSQDVVVSMWQGLWNFVLFVISCGVIYVSYIIGSATKFTVKNKKFRVRMYQIQDRLPVYPYFSVLLGVSMILLTLVCGLYVTAVVWFFVTIAPQVMFLSVRDVVKKIEEARKDGAFK